jgi:SAM-dependent methyltransferase
MSQHRTDAELRALHGAAYVPKYEGLYRQSRLDRLLPRFHLTTEDSVLDIGCGSGFLAPQVRSYTGIDFSQPFIDRATELNSSIPNATFRCVDLTALPAEPARFDVLFALDVAEHVPDEPWLELLTAARTILRPGGRFYIHTPNAAFVLERMKARNLLVKQFPEHVAVRNPDQHTALLSRAGFQVEVQGIAHYNVLRVVHPLRHLPLVGPAFVARLLIVAR